MTKEKPRSKGGRKPLHGGYSLLPARLAMQYPQLQRYLRQIRKDLIDHAGGPDKMTAPQEVLVNSIVNKLVVCRLIEIFIQRTSPFDLSQLKKAPPVLSLQPALGINYLAFSNSIDRGLALLGLEKPKHMTDPLVIDILREDERAKADEQADRPDQADDDDQNDQGNG